MIVVPEEKIRRLLKGNYAKKHKIYSHFEYVDPDPGRAKQFGSKCLLGTAAAILIFVIAIMATFTLHSTCK